MSRAPIPIIPPTLEAYLGLAHYAVIYIHMTIYPSAYCTRSVITYQNGHQPTKLWHRF